MKPTTLILSGIFVFMLSAYAIGQAAEMKIDFKGETPSTESKMFSAVAGNWHIDKDDHTMVYAVDGRKRGPEFPLSVFKGVKEFKNGTIEVSFKAISGEEDQAAGIAFNIRSKDDYLMIRANALENNLILFKMEKGTRSSLHGINHVPTATNQWHTLKVALHGSKIEGYLDGKKYLEYTYKDNIGGEIGLWSKADSYVFFDKFTIIPAE